MRKQIPKREENIVLSSKKLEYEHDYDNEEINATVTSQEIRRSAAFTGYRPSKLPFGYDTECDSAKALYNNLMNEYRKLIDLGFRYFLTGGAAGSDMMAADIVLQLRKEYKGQRIPVSLVLCLPCYNHFKDWRQEDKEHFQRIKEESSQVIYVSKSDYYDGCMQKRNKFMVDTSAILLAVYDGKSGGTKNTIEYAMKQKRKIVTVRPGGMRVETFSKPADLDALSLFDVNINGNTENIQQDTEK